MVAACFLFARLFSSKTFHSIPFFLTRVLLQLDEFVSRLKETKVGHRHFYEVDSVDVGITSDFYPDPVSQVIRHGNACHAYMDIEFAMALNSGLDGDTMTQASSVPLICKMAPV